MNFLKAILTVTLVTVALFSFHYWLLGVVGLVAMAAMYGQK